LQEVGYLPCHLGTPQQYISYLDPFNCECRAFGRLKEEGREDLAVKTYGDLLLTSKQETILTKRVLGWDSDDGSYEDEAYTIAGRNGNNTWGRFEQHRQLPIRAIVKELVDDKPFEAAQLLQLWPELEELHKLGILVGDVHGGNYLG
jgi:hypothetical protein